MDGVVHIDGSGCGRYGLGWGIWHSFGSESFWKWGYTIPLTNYDAFRKTRS